jgi:glyoxylase I family protein
MPFELRGATTLLQVYDMPTSVRFYRDLLGFSIVNTSPPLGGEDRFHWVWFRRDNVDIMLNTAYESEDERPPLPDPMRVSAHGDTCLYFACPDVDAAYEELRGKRVSVKQPKVASYGMKQIYLDDPDGYCLCFQWPAS